MKIEGTIPIPNQLPIHLSNVIGLYKDRGGNTYWLKIFKDGKLSKRNIPPLTSEDRAIVKRACEFNQAVQMYHIHKGKSHE